MGLEDIDMSHFKLLQFDTITQGVGYVVYVYVLVLLLTHLYAGTIKIWKFLKNQVIVLSARMQPEEEEKETPIVWTEFPEAEWQSERMHAGSDLQTISSVPLCVGQIQVLCEKGWVHIASCFRMEDALLTAYHAVQTEGKYRIRVPRTGKIMEFKGGEKGPWNKVEADMGVLYIGNSVLSDLGLKKPKTASIVANFGMSQMAECVSHYKDGTVRKSIGRLKMATDIFGSVVYDGSTKPGFSGAPYVVGEVVYGMHLGGAAVNMGYDAEYLRIMAAQFNNEAWVYKVEEYIAKMSVSQRKSLRITRSLGDPDEYLVLIPGRGFILADYEDLKDYWDDLRPMIADDYKKTMRIGVDYEPEMDGVTFTDAPTETTAVEKLKVEGHKLQEKLEESVPEKQEDLKLQQEIVAQVEQISGNGVATPVDVQGSLLSTLTRLTELCQNMEKSLSAQSLDIVGQRETQLLTFLTSIDKKLTNIAGQELIRVPKKPLSTVISELPSEPKLTKGQRQRKKKQLSKNSSEGLVVCDQTKSLTNP